ncbi:MAG: DarT ssDNA thymidine ADP-ribosyltransferase family protein [Nitrospiraceae bacterium]
MDLETFLRLVRNSTQQRVLFHFTDTRNLPSIRQHGLLSVQQLVKLGVRPVAPGGNAWSRDADQNSGMDAYVHLCFMKGHPMEYCARQDGRIVDVRYLWITPEVLALPGVMITDDVANQAGVCPGPAGEMLDRLDLEVMYRRTDWQDSVVKERLLAARRCEILVPDSVPVQYIRNF